MDQVQPSRVERRMTSTIEEIKRFFDLTSRLFKVLGNWGRALWVFAVPLAIILITLLVFWSLDQGKDLLIAAADHYVQVTAGAFATVFMAYVTWYMSRSLANARATVFEQMVSVYRHGPRLLGFSVFSIVLIGLWNTLGPVWVWQPWHRLLVMLFSLPAAYHACRFMAAYRRTILAMTVPPREAVAFWHRRSMILAPLLAQGAWFMDKEGAQAWAPWMMLFSSIGVLYPVFSHFSLRIAKAVPGDTEDSKVVMRRLSLLLVLVTFALVFLSGLGGHALIVIGCGVLGQFVFTCYVTNRRHFSKRVRPWNPEKQQRWVRVSMMILRPLLKLLGFLVPVMNLLVKPAIAWLARLEKEFIDSIDQRTEQMKGDDPTAGHPNYYRILNFFTAVGILLFIFTCRNEDLAIKLGGAAIALLGLTVVMVVLAFISLFSIWLRFNGYLVLFALALLLGQQFETHRVALLPREPQVPSVKERLGVKEYLRSWVALRQQDILRSDSLYPVYFILADGGASRSGYWVASVLARLHEESHGNFSDHLFCLSGASGGSWGNGAYYAWLEQQRARRFGRGVNNGALIPYDTRTMVDDSLPSLARNTLEQDFLSFTLAHMLGNDWIGLLMPPLGTLWGDRARALERTLERSGRVLGEDSLFKRPFGEYLNTDPLNGGQLPILFINVTRMQDARPGVISTIDLDSAYFGQRIDVLEEMPDSLNMRLSTAIAMGSRFPYISPAGYLPNGADNHYYVDGGYFDNSGAGAVHELLLEIQPLLKDTTVVPAGIAGKLRFHVIHINNTEQKPDTLEHISTFVNDLLSPVVTLAGSYGMQTNVNDARLAGYLPREFGPRGVYDDVNLYLGRDEPGWTGHEPAYSMNWVISDTTRHRMDARCTGHPEIPHLLREMKRP